MLHSREMAAAFGGFLFGLTLYNLVKFNFNKKKY